MPKELNTIYSGLKLTAIVAAIMTFSALATGCISAKSRPVDEADASTAAPATPAPAVPAVPVVADTPDDPSDEPAEELTSWIVAKGEHLWGISSVEEVFNLAEQWPLLYKSNLDQIEDADLIYPGQVLQIPRDASQSEIDAAIQHARNRGAWALGPVEATDTQYISNSY